MKRILLAVAVLAGAVSAMAETRSAETAAQIAAQTLSAQAGTIRRATPNPALVLSNTVLTLSEAEPAYYVFNSSESGFVIVSGDTRFEPVLLYSNEGTLDLNNVNPSMRWWMERMRRQISILTDDELLADEAVAYTAISPLLGNTAWDQEAPYSDYCPMSYYAPKEHCLTGCVATATAQIMRFWQWPNKPSGQKTYSYKEYKDYYDQKGYTRSESINFDTITFDWSNMKDTYSSGSYTAAQGRAVAQLMHACGVACSMEYGSYDAGGSGSWTDDMGFGLCTYLGYKTPKFITYYTKSDYEDNKGDVADIPCQWGLSTAAFLDSIYVELEAGRPVLLGGEDEDGGHEFVCDGRDANGNLHINWGWSGDGNCYTSITTMKCSVYGSSYKFKDGLDALIRIIPDRKSSALTTTDAASSVEKRIVDGQVVIIRDGVTYSVLGTVR